MNIKIIFLNEKKSRQLELEWELKTLWKANNIWNCNQTRQRVRELFKKIDSEHKGIVYGLDKDIMHALMFFQNAPITEVRISAYKLLYGMTQEEALEWDKR